MTKPPSPFAGVKLSDLVSTPSPGPLDQQLFRPSQPPAPPSAPVQQETPQEHKDVKTSKRQNEKTSMCQDSKRAVPTISMTKLWSGRRYAYQKPSNVRLSGSSSPCATCSIARWAKMTSFAPVSTLSWKISTPTVNRARSWPVSARKPNDVSTPFCHDTKTERRLTPQSNLRYTKREPQTRQPPSSSRGGLRLKTDWPTRY
jgi:hypothetical protein